MATLTNSTGSTDSTGTPDVSGLATRDQLRLVVAGSVDDGKSTLVGRLLYDTKSILSDTYDAIEEASRRRGASAVDLALLTDGLRAEREQGITIDVAYRYFSTPRRSFILADTPGHTQYTRNTVTGASTADAALILVDARNGALVQTRRHAAVMALLDVPHLIVAVNKMDAVSWSQERFEEVADEIRAITARLGIEATILPVSALTGQNIVSTDTVDAGSDWWTGPSLLEVLETLPSRIHDPAAAFRMPVQLVLRPRTAEHPDYRGLAGRLTSGTLHVGDEVVAHPSGLRSVVTGIDTPDGSVESAGAGESVTVLLRDELDVGRGEVLARTSDSADDATADPETVTELVGVTCWLDERPGTPGQRLLVKVGTRVVRGILTSLAERWDVDAQLFASLPEGEAPRAELNDITRVVVRLAEPAAVDPYLELPDTGSFLLIDPAGGATLAAGMVGDPLTRAFDPGI
ncbi:MAG: GTP-binding protein [Mobilicoccus sp.]|nr:GTP-binding protein [Mobilicoccus sp.]